MNKAAIFYQLWKSYFLTRNNQKLHIVNDDGSYRKNVSDNLVELRERLRETAIKLTHS